MNGAGTEPGAVQAFPLPEMRASDTAFPWEPGFYFLSFQVTVFHRPECAQ